MSSSKGEEKNMFFRKDTDIQIDENIIKKNHIPILVRDKQWKDIISTKANKNIQSFSKNIENLLNEERELTKLLKDSKQHKTKLMNKILHLSDLLNRKGQEDVVAELEKCKEEINKTNHIIDETIEKLEIYPKEIERVNLALLKETINIVYKDISNDNEKLHAIDEEINVLREKLGNLRDEKDELEKNIEMLYSFLHTVIGHEEMEKLDIRFLKE